MQEPSFFLAAPGYASFEGSPAALGTEDHQDSCIRQFWQPMKYSAPDSGIASSSSYSPYAGLDFLGGSNEPSATSETKLTPKSPDSVNVPNPVAPLVDAKATTELLGLFDLLGLVGGSDETCIASHGQQLG